jgi:hypothetical protein
MSKVIGKNRNVSGRATPKDSLSITPSRTAKPTIKLLPKSQLPKFGFSFGSSKYGRTATVKSVMDRKYPSSKKKMFFQIRLPKRKEQTMCL